MSAKQKVVKVTRTRTRKKKSGKKGGRKRCPVCGRYY